MHYIVQYSTLHVCNHCTCGQFVVLVHLLQPVIVRYELAKERITARKKIDGASHGDGRYIYNSKKNYDFMDFAVDEHGLWLIYTTKVCMRHEYVKVDRYREETTCSSRRKTKSIWPGHTVLQEHYTGVVRVLASLIIDCVLFLGQPQPHRGPSQSENVGHNFYAQCLVQSFGPRYVLCTRSLVSHCGGGGEDQGQVLKTHICPCTHLPLILSMFCAWH